MKLYRRLAMTVEALANCVKHPDDTVRREWAIRHRELIEQLMLTAPSGSGIDAGTKYLDGGPVGRLTFTTSFHHMNDVGYYDGWTEHTVVVTPSLASGIEIRITGVNRNEIKDYLTEVFQEWLRSEVP